MQNEENHRSHEQQVEEAGGDVESGPTQQPDTQQDDEEDE